MAKAGAKLGVSTPSVSEVVADLEHALSVRLLDRTSRDGSGSTEAMMLAHGFTIELIFDLIFADRVTVHPEHVAAGERVMEIVRVRITAEGQRVLAED